MRADPHPTMVVKTILWSVVPIWFRALRREKGKDPAGFGRTKALARYLAVISVMAEAEAFVAGNQPKPSRSAFECPGLLVGNGRRKGWGDSGGLNEMQAMSGNSMCLSKRVLGCRNLRARRCRPSLDLVLGSAHFNLCCIAAASRGDYASNVGDPSQFQITDDPGVAVY